MKTTTKRVTQQRRTAARQLLVTDQVKRTEPAEEAPAQPVKRTAGTKRTGVKRTTKRTEVKRTEQVKRTDLPKPETLRVAFERVIDKPIEAAKLYAEHLKPFNGNASELARHVLEHEPKTTASKMRILRDRIIVRRALMRLSAPQQKTFFALGVIEDAGWLIVEKLPDNQWDKALATIGKLAAKSGDKKPTYNGIRAALGLDKK